jgi:YidC/Oxa1 family membrane protein insertase
MQQKMMKWMMILFGFMFYKVAAGLCIYFIASSLWGLTERKLLPKAKPKVDIDTDKLVSEAVGSRGGSEDVTAGDGSRKPGRGKRKPEKKTAQPEAPATGLGRLRQRLSDWWNDVLEQAKKK